MLEVNEMTFVPEKAYTWKHLFVVQSGLIDPQPGYPCDKPGQLMYDNHITALNFSLSDGWELNYNTPLDIHRLLTRGVSYFEDSGMSGKYRDCDVWIGDDLCPKHITIPNLMKQWFNITKKLMDDHFDSTTNKFTALEIAWISHHMFEVVHPFIDGNGRTGRLLLNKVLSDLGHDPVIVNYDNRISYYNCIQRFRDRYFDGTQFLVNELYLK